ncbi:hypothetical protein JXA88_10695 [Candidatus Fermentibacteria bacterium]|nr:hypothetical protein [Candidatus Fermentibacteria bacterium]
MRTIQGISVTLAVLAATIGIIAVFSAPAMTEDWWTDDPYDMDWCADCVGAQNDWSCQWTCGGAHDGDYLCDDYSYFQNQQTCWTDCGVPCGDR